MMHQKKAINSNNTYKPSVLTLPFLLQDTDTTIVSSLDKLKTPLPNHIKSFLITPRREE